MSSKELAANIDIAAISPKGDWLVIITLQNFLRLYTINSEHEPTLVHETKREIAALQCHWLLDKLIILEEKSYYVYLIKDKKLVAERQCDLQIQDTAVIAWRFHSVLCQESIYHLITLTNSTTKIYHDKGHFSLNEPLFCTAPTTQDKFLYSLTVSAKLVCWDTSKTPWKAISEQQLEINTISSACFTSDVSTLVIADERGNIKCWQLKDNECNQYNEIVTKHSQAIYQCSFEASNQILLCTSYDGSMSFWKMNYPNCEHKRIIKLDHMPISFYHGITNMQYISYDDHWHNLALEFDTMSDYAKGRYYEQKNDYPNAVNVFQRHPKSIYTISALARLDYIACIKVLQSIQSQHAWRCQANAEAKLYHGLCYEFGWGKAIDIKKALKAYVQSGLCGCIEAEYQLQRLRPIIEATGDIAKLKDSENPAALYFYAYYKSKPALTLEQKTEYYLNATMGHYLPAVYQLAMLAKEKIKIAHSEGNTYFLPLYQENEKYYKAWSHQLGVYVTGFDKMEAWIKLCQSFDNVVIAGQTECVIENECLPAAAITHTWQQLSKDTQTIKLTNCEITDKHLKILIQCWQAKPLPNLKKLILDNNQITILGALELLEHINKQKITLSVLSLNYNYLFCDQSEFVLSDSNIKKMQGLLNTDTHYYLRANYLAGGWWSIADDTNAKVEFTKFDMFFNILEKKSEHNNYNVLDEHGNHTSFIYIFKRTTIDNNHGHMLIHTSRIDGQFELKHYHLKTDDYEHARIDMSYWEPEGMLKDFHNDYVGTSFNLNDEQRANLEDRISKDRLLGKDRKLFYSLHQRNEEEKRYDCLTWIESCLNDIGINFKKLDFVVTQNLRIVSHKIKKTKMKKLASSI